MRAPACCGQSWSSETRWCNERLVDPIGRACYHCPLVKALATRPEAVRGNDAGANEGAVDRGAGESGGLPWGGGGLRAVLHPLWPPAGHRTLDHFRVDVLSVALTGANIQQLIRQDLSWRPYNESPSLRCARAVV